MASHVVLVSGQCQGQANPTWHVPCLHAQERRVARGQAQLGSLLCTATPNLSPVTALPEGLGLFRWW